MLNRPGQGFQFSKACCTPGTFNADSVVGEPEDVALQSQPRVELQLLVRRNTLRRVLLKIVDVGPQFVLEIASEPRFCA